MSVHILNSSSNEGVDVTVVTKGATQKLHPQQIR
eukprot:CAMPEP_0202714588 /NCGR_PEP_ID=MMETSP1385-20130828/76330_1 /ASSEMBLY_ACC=CAM_ASM_000861 /TAXON_ID=933848 /ORGANISM="Elphidium margaritaceum" /LENGTH=33 /DNA_ID= /DNA_START= /DNA_END= /DNA_ORIENTATION=